jgi:Ser/Thr protein kinase RdoA (MazF antagonist)
MAEALFKTNGVLLIRDLFPQAFIDNLYQSFINQYQSKWVDQDDADVLEVGDRRKMLTIDIQDTFNTPELYGNPFLLQLLERLLGSGFVLGSFGAVIALPGAKDQHIHRDHPPLFEDEALSLQIPSFAITVVIPLIDLTAETGSTRLWKGSHKLAPSQDLAMEASSVPWVKQGSCYLMDYQLLHGGTANISPQVRPILYLVYYRSWFQEAVNYEKQARLLLSKSEYHKVPQECQFLFERVRESLGILRTEPSPSFEQLTATKQAQVLKREAEKSLVLYGLDHGLAQSHLTLISHGDNTVFAVTSFASVGSTGTPELSHLQGYDRFSLRVHRSRYLSALEIESELLWLQHLCHTSQLSVPEPISSLDGKLWVTLESPTLDDRRTVSITGWLPGRSFGEQFAEQELTGQDFAAIGRLLGQLHDSAAHYSFPPHFSRPFWNWQGLLGQRAGYSNHGHFIWQKVPHSYRPLFETISEKARSVLDNLGEAGEQFGLIHGDFWLGNLLWNDRHIAVIDFADCGFGYWGYDVARFFNDFFPSPYFEPGLEHFLAGYSQIRSFPKAQVSLIPLFLAIQQVSFALWRINRAQDHPGFRSTLEKDLQQAAETIESIFNLAAFNGT